MDNSSSQSQSVLDKPLYFFYRYIPEKSNLPATDESIKIRKNIWDFKDGRRQFDFQEKVACKIEEILTQQQQDGDQLTFVCVPASTVQSNKERYERFSKFICMKLGLNNGFDYIKIIKEKIPSHRGGGVDAVYSLDGAFFKEKKVILFDDVITSGRSMLKFIRELEANGAKVIACVALAKTYNRYFEQEKNPIHPFTGTAALSICLIEDNNSVSSSYFDFIFEENVVKKTEDGLKPVKRDAPRFLHFSAKTREFPDSCSGKYYENISVGSNVNFGSFYDKPIEWFVLDRVDTNESSKILLMSKNGLVCRPYSTNRILSDWESSDIRHWLNTVFLEKSFGFEERNSIASITIEPEFDVNHELNAGSATNDKIFILSISEYERYFLNTGKRWKCRLLDGTERQCWLRNYGTDRYHAAFIGRSGSIHAGGSFVDSPRNTVRPLLWIDLRRAKGLQIDLPVNTNKRVSKKHF